MGDKVETRTVSTSVDFTEHLRQRGEDGYAALLCTKIREIASLLKTDSDRNFSNNPLCVEDIAEALAADLDFPLRPAHTHPFVLDEATGQFVPDRERIYWRGESDTARILNAQMLIMTYWTGGDF